jgi:hypothetical protein
MSQKIGGDYMAYQYTNSRGQEYYLHSKEVKLRGGDRIQRIYYFATDVRREAIESVPEGFQVIESKKTGLPVLKRQ